MTQLFHHKIITLILIFAAMVSIFISHWAWAGTLTFSFNESVEMALKNNDQIRATKYDIDLSKAKLEQAHPKSIPVVKYEYRLAPVPQDIDNPADSFFGGDISVFNEVKVELGSALTTFGKIKTAQELAQLGINAAWFKRSKTTNEVIGKMYQVYEGIILARELLALAKQAQNALSDKIQDLEKEKIQDQIQILKLKVALFEIDRRVEEAQKKKLLAFEALKFQMGLVSDVNIDIKDKTLLPVNFQLKGVDYYLDKAHEYLPEFKLLATGLKAKEKQLALQKLDPAPNLGVGGFVDVGRAPAIRGAGDENNFTNPFNFTKAGLGFQLQGQFDYVKNRSQVKQAEADLLKTVYEKRAAVGGLELDIRKTYQDVVEAKRLMIKSEDEKKVARQLAFLTKSNADIGIGEKKDYYDTLQSYLVFQGRSFEAVYNYNIAVAMLKQKIGVFHDYQKRDSL
ncbi:MAG: outer membrane efflux protein [uncultured bacterium]|nr:MAG: outer membrane efflux protein [uncultured bacterium]